MLEMKDSNPFSLSHICQLPVSLRKGRTTLCDTELFLFPLPCVNMKSWTECCQPQLQLVEIE